MTRNLRTPLALALTALALGACTARDAVRSSSRDGRYASLDAVLDGRHSAALTRPATPIAVLPGWAGRPVHLRERDASNAFEQAVSLSLAPRGAAQENRVLLRLPRTDRDDAAGAGDLVPNGRPTEAGIHAELAAAFPGMVMQVVTRPAANVYGPYGLAVGRTAGGARCLYAWQWIAAAPDLDPASGRPGPLSLRVRLCRDDITLDAMAAAVDQIKLVPRYAGTPVTAPPRALASARRPARPRTAVRPPEAAPAGMAEPAVAVPPVALPAGRRYLGVSEPAVAPGDTPALGEAGPGPAALSRAFVGTPHPAQAETTVADLPPEAFRGPVARAPARP